MRIGEIKMPLRLTLAERIYTNLKPKPAEPAPKRPQIDGWAPQRAQWGEVDHRTRGPVSPLDGTVKVKK
jgi:hypothetical protein